MSNLIISSSASTALSSDMQKSIAMALHGMGQSRGCQVVEAFQAPSGFLYTTQQYEAQLDQTVLCIEEGMAKGTGVAYLCRLRILNNGQTLAEQQYRDIYYTRDRACQEAIVLLANELRAHMVRKGEQDVPSVQQLQQAVRSRVEQAYYAKTDGAAMSLLRELGF